MPYPNEIDRFTNKLNKKVDGSRHVIEEQINITGGVFNGSLSHDNIVKETIRIYTGPKMTGVKVNNFVVSVPAETPWKTNIKIFSDTTPVYVTYETLGDTIEAEDINIIQDSITATQIELERYKSEGVIDGGTFTREE